MAAGGENRNHDSLDEKRKLVLEDDSSGKRRIIAVAVTAVIILACAGLWFGINRGDRAEPAVQAYDANPGDAINTGSSKNDTAEYDLSLFNDGEAHFFRFKYQGTEIRYFILKDSDGIVHAAFDACDVCWRAGKGYTQRGDVMVCNNCGREFPSDMIGKVSGGCNPAPLVSTVSGGRVTVMNSDIIKGLQYFRGI